MNNLRKITLLIMVFWFSHLNGNEAEFLLFANPESEEETNIYRHLYHTFLKDLTPRESPLIIAIGGAPGSGKTTWRKQYLNHVTNVHLHDMDEVLIRLPKYQEDLLQIGAIEAFKKWWPRARTLADKLVQYAIKKDYSIIYDRTCGADNTYYDLCKAKEKGYRIELVGFCVNSDIALERIAARENKEGRALTKAIFNEYRSRFSALWPYYLTFVDQVVLYDTSHELKLIFSNRTILELTQYEAFLRDGDSFKDYFMEKLGKRPSDFFECSD